MRRESWIRLRSARVVVTNVRRSCVATPDTQSANNREARDRIRVYVLFPNLLHRPSCQRQSGEDTRAETFADRCIGQSPIRAREETRLKDENSTLSLSLRKKGNEHRTHTTSSSTTTTRHRTHTMNSQNTYQNPHRYAALLPSPN